MASVRSTSAVLGLFATLAGASEDPVSAVTADQRPITKVVTLLSEMKKQAEKEASDDMAAYDKYNCWCETNEQDKTESIANAEQRISELAAFIEASTAKQGQLKTEIEGLTEDIADDQAALESATGLRQTEHANFLTEEADMKETRGLLQEAITALSGVQLVQKPAGRKTAARALIQVRDIVDKRFPKFKSVMQQDLFDVLGSLRGASSKKADGVALEQDKLLPWEKTEEQVGMEGKPNSEHGAVQAKSYNSRSGRILGVLDEMHSEFSRDLGNAQKADLVAEIEFQKLRAAKLLEITTATEQKETKEAELADSLYKSAKAQENKESVEAVMTSDQKFMLQLGKLCKDATEEYNARVKVRSEEIRALSEALKILTEDSARDLFGKTMSFIQTRSVSQAQLAAEDKASERAMQRIAEVAKKNKNWALASLAVRVRLDAFTQVKAAMDKMLATLQKQQKEEYDKKELCDKEIDTTEDNIKVHNLKKEDLDNKHTELTNTINTIKTNIALLQKDVADMEISLKKAGEERHEENAVFQASVSDQRATVNILNKVLVRLEAFYSKSGASLVEVHPDTYNAPPPAKPKGYDKQAKAGGVLQMLHTIISDAEVAEQQLTMSEQKQQTDYADFVRMTTESIEANRASLAEKQAQVASNSAELSETEESQLANDATLAELDDLLKAHHIDCDYTLKYFDVRQQARAEEIGAIQDAKAILSGARFGR